MVLAKDIPSIHQQPAAVFRMEIGKLQTFRSLKIIKNIGLWEIPSVHYSYVYNVGLGLAYTDVPQIVP